MKLTKERLTMLIQEAMDDMPPMNMAPGGGGLRLEIEGTADSERGFELSRMLKEKGFEIISISMEAQGSTERKMHTMLEPSYRASIVASNKNMSADDATQNMNSLDELVGQMGFDIISAFADGVKLV